MSELWGGGAHWAGAKPLMGRLRRFPDHRFIGRRDLMIAYDCDAIDELQELESATDEMHLDQQNLLQAFAPDTLMEARNRGFSGRSSRPETQ